jgi:hypothetical protein
LKNSWNHFSRRNYFWWVPFWNFVQHFDNYYIEASIEKNLLRFLPKTDRKLQCYCSEKNILMYETEKKIYWNLKLHKIDPAIWQLFSKRW